MKASGHGARRPNSVTRAGDTPLLSNSVRNDAEAFSDVTPTRRIAQLENASAAAFLASDDASQ